MKGILTICLLVQSLLMFSQNSSNFEVINVGTKYSLDQLILAFNQTNLCGYFKTNDFVHLTLDDSSIIRLKKKSDLEQIGINLESDCFDIKNFQLENEVWSISDSFLMCEKRKFTKM